MARTRTAVFLCLAGNVIAAALVSGCAAGGHAPAPAVSAARSGLPAAASGGSAARAGSAGSGPKRANASLAGVSCTSASACVAVGSTEVATLAERWDGRRWAIQPAPSPGSGAALSAVSCAGPAWCMAVGSSGGLTSRSALAELWNGRSWSVRLPVTPRGGEGRLLAVSCPAPGMCMAVGDHGDSPALAELWNGKRWAALSLAPLPGAQITSLESVSCTSPAACTAVGLDASSSSGPGTVAERWNGARWTVQVTPAASDVPGVSCAAATACTAVGRTPYRDGGYQVSAAMGWQGTQWTAQAARNPAHNSGAELSGVSCPSRAACIAVGNYTPARRPGTTAVLAERWDGTRWALLAAPTPHAGEDNLTGVSCTSAAACMAVGADGGGPLAERWDGTRWVSVPAPSPRSVPVPGSGSLAGVSCISPASCTAVGSQSTTAVAAVPLAEHWDGSRWSAQPVPDPVVTGGGSQLAAVSCASRDACTAVGQRGGFAGLAERWDGHRWAVQPGLPWKPTSLLGVDCTLARSCTAAGLYSPAARLLALAEHWNGARWARQHTPPAAPGAGGVQLNGIGCSSAAACTAVGSAGSAPVIERWNGTTWGMQRSPPVTHPGPGQLAAVSCPAAAVCFAAGNTGGDNASNFSAFALAERWDGTTWVIQRLPQLAGTLSSYLNGISCSSPTACTAVGRVFLRQTAGAVTLAERWNGKTWAIQHTPNPPNRPGAIASLNAVSCPSATTCVAVGDSDSGALTEVWDGKTWALQQLPGSV